MKPLSLLERLQAVRRGGPLIDAVALAQRPQGLQEAYAIAAALHTPDTEIGGYKIGATSARGRQLLGLAGPFYGRVVKDTLTRSPASIRLGGRTLALEPEIGCQMGVGLPARGTPYSRGEVAASVRRVLPLIELYCPSFAAPFEVGGLCLIADNGVNVGAVTGYPGSSGLNVIGASRVEVRVNGGAQVRGAPRSNRPTICLPIRVIRLSMNSNRRTTLNCFSCSAPGTTGSTSPRSAAAAFPWRAMPAVMR